MSIDRLRFSPDASAAAAGKSATSNAATGGASRGSSASGDARPYVLGTGLDELQRLGLQHRLWSDAALSAWKLAGVQIGHRVLDVGSGPGFAAFDLAALVGPESAGGLVVALDESASFIDHLNQQARSRGLTQVHGLVGDAHAADRAVQGAGLGWAGTFDMAYARWLLCFLPRPEQVVAAVANLLGPGGKFVVHDYYLYETMTMGPRRRSHDLAVAATAKSWRDRGGDPDIAGRLPRLMAAAGLRVRHVTVHHRVARGTDSMFMWPDVWWRTYAPKLVEMGYLAADAADELMRDLDEVKRSETDYIVTPPVFELIAEKPA